VRNHTCVKRALRARALRYPHECARVRAFARVGACVLGERQRAFTDRVDAVCRSAPRSSCAGECVSHASPPHSAAWGSPDANRTTPRPNARQAHSPRAPAEPADGPRSPPAACGPAARARITLRAVRGKASMRAGGGAQRVG
jgi:hypothetical protein